MARARGALAVLIGLAAIGMVLAGSGCGGGEGVAAGATVDAYVGASARESFCLGAQNQAGKAGDVNLRVICLRDPTQGGRLDLATVGANARRATEDSAAIAYVEPKGPANRFAQPIVEEAGIAWIGVVSGGEAIELVTKAVEEAGSGSLRDEVRDALEAG